MGRRCDIDEVRLAATDDDDGVESFTATGFSEVAEGIEILVDTSVGVVIGGSDFAIVEINFALLSFSLSLLSLSLSLLSLSLSAFLCSRSCFVMSLLVLFEESLEFLARPISVE